MLALALLMHNDTHFIVSFSFSKIRYWIFQSWTDNKTAFLDLQFSHVAKNNMYKHFNMYTGCVRMYRKEKYRNNSMQMQITTKVSLYFFYRQRVHVCAWGRGGGHSLLTVQNLKIRTKSTQNIASMFLFFNIKTYNSLTKNRKIREFIKTVNSVPRAVNT